MRSTSSIRYLVANGFASAWPRSHCLGPNERPLLPSASLTTSGCALPSSVPSSAELSTHAEEAGSIAQSTCSSLSLATVKSIKIFLSASVIVRRLERDWRIRSNRNRSKYVGYELAVAAAVTFFLKVAYRCCHEVFLRSLSRSTT